MAGDQLIRHRQARGMSRADLADAVRVHQSTVANLENGHQKRASVDLLTRLARVVRADVSRLVRGAE